VGSCAWPFSTCQHAQTASLVRIILPHPYTLCFVLCAVAQAQNPVSDFISQAAREVTGVTDKAQGAVMGVVMVSGARYLDGTVVAWWDQAHAKSQHPSQCLVGCNIVLQPLATSQWL
jgi:hypothetical protein